MPVELRAKHETIEAVVLRFSVPNTSERFLKFVFDRTQVVLHAARREREVANAHRSRGAERLHFVRDFRLHFESHVFEPRHDLGERHRRTGVNDLAVELALLAAMTIEVDHELAVGQHLFDVFDVVHRRMTLAECATTGILPTEANMRAFHHERSKGKRFAEGPIDGSGFGDGLAAAVDESAELRVEMEIVGE